MESHPQRVLPAEIRDCRHLLARGQIVAANVTKTNVTIGDGIAQLAA